MSLRASPSPRAAEPKGETWAGATCHAAISAQAALELRTDVGEQLDRGGSKMLAVERVQVSVAGFL